MKLLLDTHVLIWSLAEVEQLSGQAVNALTDPANTLLVSAVSGYEIELKRSYDTLLQRLPATLEEAVIKEGFRWRPILAADGIRAGRLPWHDKDPWDRLLVAQSLNDDIPIVSADERLERYGAKVIW